MATDNEIEAAAKKLYEWHGVKSMVDAREMAREAMEAAEKVRADVGNEFGENNPAICAKR